MLIGNVVCERELNIDDRFNVLKSIEDINPELPTLIVGINNAKMYSDNISYLDRRINDKTFWTFTRAEKRDLFEEDLFYFIEFAYNQLIKEIRFDFVDLILYDSTKINSVFKNIESSEESITFHHKNMMYTYANNEIYGFDLRQVEYIGKSRAKFIDVIKNLSNVFLQDEKILIEYKKELSVFGDEIKYVPLIYSMRNDE